MSGGDLLQEAVAELYAADPDEFVARRGELARQARTAGEAALAKQIATLRKPTRSAWVINQLVRADPGAAAQLVTLGAELRAAQQSLDGPALRELSRQRRQLIDALVRQAFRAAGQQAPPAALREEVASTLGAALADPQVAEELGAGALERVVHRDGLETAGEAPPGDAGATRPQATEPRRAARRRAEQEDADREDGPASKVVPLPSARRRGPARAGAAGSARTEAAGSARAGAGSPAAKVTTLATARVKAERERRRQAVAAAREALEQAEQAERAAAQVEGEQQDAVQLLEEQLADARQQLAEARIRAHRARTGQRQAQRALDRLLKTPQA